jgi:ABC-2 type transport system permease protein
MRSELIIAGKEIRDHVTSRRFLIIFAILLLFSIYAVVSGMDQYNKQIDSYKENQQQDWYKQQIQSIQQQIQDAQARGDPQELIDSLQYQLDQMINPSMPSVMTYFWQMNQWFVWICVLLAVALGFDLITREKEEGSLKSLLSHPVYRDSVINGKTIGAISVLCAAMGAAFLITIAVVLFFGVVPSFDDLLRIAWYFIMALLVSMAFFGLAMAASTIAKNSSMAVLYAIGIVVILVALSQFSGSIVSLIAGPAPETPIIYYSTDYSKALSGAEGVKGDVGVTNGTPARSPVDSSASSGDTPAPTDMPDSIVAPGDPIMPTPDNSAWQQWWDRQQLIQKSIDAISPLTNFQNYIANALIYDTSSSSGGILYMNVKIADWGPYGRTEAKSVWDALGSVWMNILVLIAEILAVFGIAYVKFLRTDIR